MAQQYLLLGSSAASIGALIKLRQLVPDAYITCISNQQELPYNKCLLADYLAGQIGIEKLAIYNMLKDSKTQFRFGMEITHIDPVCKYVACNDGQKVAYDFLFLGLGSSPYQPLIPGIHTSGVFTFHILADSNAILEYIQKNMVKNAVIIGAGLSGLEAADSLLKRDVHVTIVERNNMLLPAFLNQRSAEFLHKKICQAGVQLYLQSSVAQICQDSGRVQQIILHDGTVLKADLVIIATGIQANSKLAQNAGIFVGHNGIIVNQFLQTNFDTIYAGGDVIEVTDQISTLRMRSCMWPDAMMQGMLAAQAMAGQPKPYQGPCIIACSAFFGIKFAHAGIVKDCQTLKVKESADYIHQFHIENDMLKGFQVLGNEHNLGHLRRLILTKQPICPEELGFSD